MNPSNHPECVKLRHLRTAFKATKPNEGLPHEPSRFTDQEEQFIQSEVERLLHEPKLPNAGARERNWLKKLKVYARDESLVVEVKAAAGRCATAFEALLPPREFIKRGDGWLTLPGCYYTRRKVTPKTNQSLYRAARDLKPATGKDPGKRWLADFLLEGMPEPVSNFKMECLYLLQDASGNVRRLVRLVNTAGEVSKGREIGGADVLPNEMYAGAEKFRQWCLSKGNFNWGVGNGAGNLELQMLHIDVSKNAAYRVVQLIDYCGWHPLDKKASNAQAQPQSVILPGIWFYDECAYVDGERIMPDEGGIFWHEGEGYAFARKGRETEFIHGRPQMKPDLAIEVVAPKLDTSHWEQAARNGMQLALRDHNPGQMLGNFFRELCRRFYDCAGGYEGWLAVGAILGFAAAPEIFEWRKMFPGLWVSGQMGGGKTTFMGWLMSLVGFRVDAGLGLISKNVTAVGIMCQLENYSNLPVWLDEFRQAVITPDKEAVIRDIYNRQLAAKWSPDGFQRVIRTAALVSGESTTSDPATRSRYPHVLLSEQKRRAHLLASLLKEQLMETKLRVLEAEQYEWMQHHQQWFFLFWRRLMERRAEFVALVLKQMENWVTHQGVEGAPNRDRVAHAVAYAAFTAATIIFDSHGADEVTAFRKFLAEHTQQASEDVAEDVNVNVFMQEVITAYKAGAIPNSCFKLERRLLPHPPGAPDQGPWTSYVLLLSPNDVINHLQIHLRRSGASVTLRKTDLRNQLSRNDYWYQEEGKRLQKRIGGARCDAWGILADKHPLGLQHVSDEAVAQAHNQHQTLGDIGAVFGPEGDPRRGPLFAIIEGVEKAEREKEAA